MLEMQNSRVVEGEMERTRGEERKRGCVCDGVNRRVIF